MAQVNIYFLRANNCTGGLVVINARREKMGLPDQSGQVLDRVSESMLWTRRDPVTRFLPSDAIYIR